jgi:hypothetical protein
MPVQLAIAVLWCAALQADPEMMPKKCKVVINQQNRDLVVPLSFVRISTGALHRTRVICPLNAHHCLRSGKRQSIALGNPEKSRVESPRILPIYKLHQRPSSLFTTVKERKTNGPLCWDYSIHPSAISLWRLPSYCIMRCAGNVYRRKAWNIFVSLLTSSCSRG